jgi:hypothetical protein
MIMKRLSLYFILLSGVFINSCITDVDTKDLGMKPKLVLFSYLIPQLDTTIVSLTNSAPLFTSNHRKCEPVANAMVEISENNSQWIKLEYDTAYKRYFIPQADFPVKEGQTYYIRAAAPEFETVYASCTVPYFRETNVNLVFEKSINDTHYGEIYSWLHYHGFLEWNDYAGEENYYMFCEKYFNEHIITTNWGEWPWTPSYDTAYFFDWHFLYDMDYKPCIYTDNGRDGKKMSVFMMDYLPDVFETTLLQTDKNCYLFEKSVMDYDDTFSSFTLEPMQYYSNIKNGYGVFGAFVMKEYMFEFEEEE